MQRTKLWEKRKNLHLTQKRLAKRLHVSQAAVSYYETGKRKIPEDVLERFEQC